MQEEIGHECIKLLTTRRLKFILEGFSSSVYTGFSYPSKFLKYFFYQYISKYFIKQKDKVQIYS